MKKKLRPKDFLNTEFGRRNWTYGEPIEFFFAISLNLILKKTKCGNLKTEKYLQSFHHNLQVFFKN